MIIKFMTFPQRRSILKSFIESQRGCCTFVWMFCRRKINACINHIHERALAAVYNNEISPFKELLRKSKSRTMHQRNIKIWASELFKFKNNLSNDITAQLICKINSVGQRFTFGVGNGEIPGASGQYHWCSPELTANSQAKI